MLIAVLVQPIAGSISDYTISRFGRRKPYILVGTLLDVVFLIGIATSNTVLAVGRVRGPAPVQRELRAGTVPGLRARSHPARPGRARERPRRAVHGARRRGRHGARVASAWRLGDFTIPTIALGVIELVTMLSLFFRLDEGRAAKDRARRSWTSVAIEAWGRDVLRERSFMFLVASRFFVLGGGAFLIGLLVPVPRAGAGHTDPDERARADPRDDRHRGPVHGDRDDPGRAARRPVRPQAGDLRGLSHRRRGDGDLRPGAGGRRSSSSGRS